MPHFVIDCSESVVKSHEEEFIIEQVHIAANTSGLFEEGDIKVRLHPFKKYSVGNKREDFIHVFAHVMQGRTGLQKASLSQLIVTKLVELFPDIPNIAINISEFDITTYCNRAML